MVFTIGAIVIAVVSIILCLVISLQEAKQSGLGAGIAGGSDTYWSKNKSRSKQGRLVRITVIASVVFFVIAIILNIGAVANPQEVSASSQIETTAEEAADAAEDAANAEAAEQAGEASGETEAAETAAETEAANN